MGLRPNLSDVAQLLRLGEALERLQRLALDLAYPLDEVGHTFNVTRERIRQIESQSLKTLQSLTEAQKLRDIA